MIDKVKNCELCGGAHPTGQCPPGSGSGVEDVNENNLDKSLDSNDVSSTARMLSLLASLGPVLNQQVNDNEDVHILDFDLAEDLIDNTDNLDDADTQELASDIPTDDESDSYSSPTPFSIACSPGGDF